MQDAVLQLVWLGMTLYAFWVNAILEDKSVILICKPCSYTAICTAVLSVSANITREAASAVVKRKDALCKASGPIKETLTF